MNKKRIGVRSFEEFGLVRGEGIELTTMFNEKRGTMGFAPLWVERDLALPDEGMSIRFFNPTDKLPPDTKEGESWFATVKSAYISRQGESVDGRKYVHVNVKDLKRFESVSDSIYNDPEKGEFKVKETWSGRRMLKREFIERIDRADSYVMDDPIKGLVLVKKVVSGKTVISQEDIPVKEKTRNYRSKDSSMVITVREFYYRDKMIHSFVASRQTAQEFRLYVTDALKKPTIRVQIERLSVFQPT